MIRVSSIGDRAISTKRTPQDSGQTLPRFFGLIKVSCESSGVLMRKIYIRSKKLCHASLSVHPLIVFKGSEDFRQKLHRLWQTVPLTLGLMTLMACGQPNKIPEISEFTVTVNTTTNDTIAQLEQKYAGSIRSWHPEAGFAILTVTTKPSGNDAAIKGIDESTGALRASIIPTANRNPTNAASAWIGGWTSWSGGWTSWSGGWTSWSGGSSVPTLPPENSVAFSQIRLAQAQGISRKFGEGIKVAVIDTGIDLAHQAFAGHLAPKNEWKDFVDGDANPQETGTTSDHGYGHGTGVAGIILQVAPKATILPLRVLDQNGSGDLDNVVLAIDWAVAHGVDVINLSLGSVKGQESLTTQLAYAASQKVYIVSSAGNDGLLDGLTYPAAETYGDGLNGFMFGIGSVNSNDILSSFTNYGAGLWGIAPGESIFSAFPGDRVASFTGTSFAAPLYAGALALGLAELPTTADRNNFLKYLLYSSLRGPIYGNNLSARGSDKIGNGRLDIESLIRNFPGWTPKVDYGNINFVQNGLFEGGSLSSWVVTGTGMPNVVDDGGKPALQLKPDQGITQTFTGLKPKTNYTFKVTMRAASEGVGMTMSADNFGGAAACNIAQGVIYAPHYLNFTTGETNTSAQIYIRNWVTEKDPMYLRDVSVREAGY
jgi:thermitase